MTSCSTGKPAETALAHIIESGGAAAWRERIGWTNDQIAAELGIDRTTVYRIIRGDIRLTATTARLMHVLERGHIPAEHQSANPHQRRPGRPRKPLAAPADRDD